MTLKFSCAAMLLVAVQAAGLLAQTARTITGSVVDASGGTVTGAAVTLLDQTMTSRGKTQSDGSGAFTFTAPGAGRYTLLVESQKFSPARMGVEVAEGADPRPVTVTLNVAEASTSVSVTADAPLLDRVSESGSRLGLTLRELPASADVITQEDFQRRGARTFEDAINGSVGVVSGGNTSYGRGIALIRGFTQGTIAYLYDGTVASVPNMSNRPQDSWNYDRIEVLTGPASVVTGLGAVGGMINYVTRRPDRNASGFQGMISYGSFNSLRAAAGLGGKLGETGAYRLDLSHNQSDGWIQNDFERLSSLTSGVTFRPRKNMKLDLLFDLAPDDQSRYVGTILVPRANSTDPTDIVGGLAGLVVDRRTLKQNLNFRNPEASAVTVWGRANLTWELSDSWILRNRFSVYHADRVNHYIRNPIFVAPDILTRGQTDITHDHRLVDNRVEISNYGRIGRMKNRFIVGGSVGDTYFGSGRRFSNNNNVPELRTNVFNPAQGDYNPSTAISTAAGAWMYETADMLQGTFFMEDSLSLTNRLTVVGGYRFEHIVLDRTSRDVNFNTLVPYSRTYRPNTVRVGAVYRLWSEGNLYTQFSNGTAVNGSGNILALSGTNAAFPLTTGKQFEAGFKQSVASGRFDLTAAYYRIGQNNVLSRSERDPALTVNNGRVSSQGVEFSSTFHASRQLRFSGNIALIDAQFDTLIEAGGLSRVGNAPPHAPKHTANGWVDYQFKQLPLSFGIVGRRVGDTYNDNANTIRLNGYTTVDAYGNYRMRHVDFMMRVRNLNNALYANWEGINTVTVMIQPQRSADLTVKFNF